ncbi:MAG: hypothetical protein VXW32_09845 [Myxococcota bacterium]|nr:hypothetical protein [Myxococcota bacterium]
MKVYLKASGRILAPWQDSVSDIQVLGRSLASLMEEEFERAGIVRVDHPPSTEPYLLVSDRTWITGAALKAFCALASPGDRLKVDNALWLDLTTPLQDLPSPGVYEVALLPGGAEPEFDGLNDLVVDLQIEERESPREHPALAHAMPDVLPFTDAAVVQIDHWSHILQANWMAISSTFAREGRAFKRKGILAKVWGLLRLFWRARSVSKWKLARGLSHIPKSAQVHPTAVVELSVIGENAEIGPHSVVRGSVVGDGVRIEEHAIVNASVLGEGARIGKRGTANLCVLYPEAFISAGAGHQACVFGREAFLAWSVTTYDLSFGRPIKVQKDGKRVSSGVYFLGSAIGHRAKVGAHVKLGFGTEVPNDAVLVGDSETVLKNWEDGEGPHRVQSGVARPIKSSS